MPLDSKMKNNTKSLHKMSTQNIVDSDKWLSAFVSTRIDNATSKVAKTFTDVDDILTGFDKPMIIKHSDLVVSDLDQYLEQYGTLTTNDISSPKKILPSSPVRSDSGYVSPDSLTEASSYGITTSTSASTRSTDSVSSTDKMFVHLPIDITDTVNSTNDVDIIDALEDPEYMTSVRACNVNNDSKDNNDSNDSNWSDHDCKVQSPSIFTEIVTPLLRSLHDDLRKYPDATYLGECLSRHVDIFNTEYHEYYTNWKTTRDSNPTIWSKVQPLLNTEADLSQLIEQLLHNYLCDVSKHLVSISRRKPYPDVNHIRHVGRIVIGISNVIEMSHNLNNSRKHNLEQRLSIPITTLGLHQRYTECVSQMFELELEEEVIRYMFHNNERRMIVNTQDIIDYFYGNKEHLTPEETKRFKTIDQKMKLNYDDAADGFNRHDGHKVPRMFAGHIATMVNLNRTIWFEQNMINFDKPHQFNKLEKRSKYLDDLLHRYRKYVSRLIHTNLPTDTVVPDIWNQLMKQFTYHSDPKIETSKKHLLGDSVYSRPFLTMLSPSNELPEPIVPVIATQGRSVRIINAYPESLQSMPRMKRHIRGTTWELMCQRDPKELLDQSDIGRKIDMDYTDDYLRSDHTYSLLFHSIQKDTSNQQLVVPVNNATKVKMLVSSLKNTEPIITKRYKPIPKEKWVLHSTNTSCRPVEDIPVLSKLTLTWNTLDHLNCLDMSNTNIFCPIGICDPVHKQCLHLELFKKRMNRIIHATKNANGLQTKQKQIDDTLHILTGSDCKHLISNTRKQHKYLPVTYMKPVAPHTDTPLLLPPIPNIVLPYYDIPVTHTITMNTPYLNTYIPKEDLYYGINRIHDEDPDDDEQWTKTKELRQMYFLKTLLSSIPAEITNQYRGGMMRVEKYIIDMPEHYPVRNQTRTLIHIRDPNIYDMVNIIRNEPSWIKEVHILSTAPVFGQCLNKYSSSIDTEHLVDATHDIYNLRSDIPSPTTDIELSYHTVVTTNYTDHKGIIYQNYDEKCQLIMEHILFNTYARIILFSSGDSMIWDYLQPNVTIRATEIFHHELVSGLLDVSLLDAPEPRRCRTFTQHL